MIKRTIEISGHDCLLRVSHGQLQVERDGALLGEVPAEDVGLLIVDTSTARYSHSSMVTLLEHGAVVVLCGQDHLPAGILLPVFSNTLHAQRIRAQASAGKPLVKRLWQQIVQAKISAQAGLLSELGRPEASALKAMVERVHSGDPQNVEAQAARRYWPALLGSDFRRDRHGAPPNGLLNYGYMAVRAAMARALCGAGLHPSFGLHHCNQYNSFALADDLFEPLRPLVDRVVISRVSQGKMDVDKDAKRILLSLLADETMLYGLGRGPLLIAMERYAASLAQCFSGEREDLEIPCGADIPATRSAVISPLPLEEGRVRAASASIGAAAYKAPSSEVDNTPDLFSQSSEAAQSPPITSESSVEEPTLWNSVDGEECG